VLPRVMVCAGPRGGRTQKGLPPMIVSRLPRLGLLVLLVGLLLVAPRTVSILPAAAATTSAAFLVTSTTDAPDAAPGDGVCASTAGGACTVRAAIQEANAQPAGSTVYITLPAGHYLLTLGELDLITNTVVISGAGARRTVVDAGGRSRALHVFPHSRVWLGLGPVSEQSMQ